jgi:hypothetical protein
MENQTFVHSFRTLVHYQKNVLKTLVSNKINETKAKDDAIKTEEGEELDELKEKIQLEKVLSISDMEDADMEANQSNDSLFQYFIQKIQKQAANSCKVTILCSHVTHNDDNKTGIRFPFIQYLLEKKAFNHQQFELPSVMLDSDDINGDSNVCERCASIVTNYISQLYRSVFPGAAELTVENCYVGACHLGENKDIYVMLDVSKVWPDVLYAGISSKNQASFALPSEIINTRHVYGFAIEDKTTQLFAEYPELTKLNSFSQNSDSVQTSNTFPVPDVGYTFSPDILSARLACMVGPPKTCTPKTCDDEDDDDDASFHFHDDLQLHNEIKNSINQKALTRYAVYYPEDKPVYDYDLFLPMTYHILNGKKDGIL